jgi:hypothetical protein
MDERPHDRNTTGVAAVTVCDKSPRAQLKSHHDDARRAPPERGNYVAKNALRNKRRRDKTRWQCRAHNARCSTAPTENLGISIISADSRMVSSYKPRRYPQSPRPPTLAANAIFKKLPSPYFTASHQGSASTSAHSNRCGRRRCACSRGTGTPRAAPARS